MLIRYVKRSGIQQHSISGEILSEGTAKEEYKIKFDKFISYKVMSYKYMSYKFMRNKAITDPKYHEDLNYKILPKKYYH